MRDWVELRQTSAVKRIGGCTEKVQAQAQALLIEGQKLPSLNDINIPRQTRNRTERTRLR